MLAYNNIIYCINLLQKLSKLHWIKINCIQIKNLRRWLNLLIYIYIFKNIDEKY
jgi:hypothetical protein